MIIYILVALTILMFVSWFFITQETLRWFCGILSTGLLLLFMVALSGNMASHWGMVEQSRTTTSNKIYSAGSPTAPVNMLIYRRLGTKAANNVFVFRDHPADKTATAHFVPNRRDIRTASKKRAVYRFTFADEPEIKTTRREWVFKSLGYCWLFLFDHNDHQLISQKTIIKVPQATWVILSANQAKKLSAMQKKRDPTTAAATQQRLKQAITAKVSAYVQAHPQMTSAQIKNYKRQVTTQLAVIVMRQTIARLRKQH